MTPDDLRAAIETLWPGHGGQTRAAESFNIGSRRIREYLAGARAVPEWLASDLRALVEQFPGGMREVDPRKTLAVLHAQMIRAGFTDEQAAAAILGAARALAVKSLGADTVRRTMGDS